MKSLRWGLFFAVLSTAGEALAADVAVPPTVQVTSEDGKWQAVYNTDIRFFSFRGTRAFPAPPDTSTYAAAKGRGSQVYIPTAFQLSGLLAADTKVEFTARGGYVWSKQSTAGFSGAYSGPTDTVLSATATYLAVPGFQPFVSLNANVPTGASVLSGRAANARLDPDLVDVPAFGQGWNIGPSIGANVSFTENLILTLGAGYTRVGPFSHDEWDSFTETRARLRTDPGDSASFNASLAYGEGPVAVQVSAAYTTSRTTRREGAPLVRSGDNYGVAVAVGYSWSEAITTVLSAQASRTERNHVLDLEAGALLREMANSNSDLYRFGLDHTFKLTSDLALGATASFLHRDNNAYAPTTAQFVTAKERMSAGGVVQYSFTDGWSMNARVERIWTRERARPEIVIEDIELPGTGRPRLSYVGWSAAVGLSLQF